MKRLNIFTSNEKDYADKFTVASGFSIDGKFDLHAGAGPNILGYSHPYVTEELIKHLSSANTGYWKLKHEVWEILEDHLDFITDNRYSSFVPSLTGTDAVDNALRILWWYWQKQGQKKNTILVSKKSYHSGSISGWQMVHKETFSASWPKIQFVEFFDDLEETVQRVGAENIAGVLIDTVPWGSGLTGYSHEYWSDFQKVIDSYGLILCVDEVLTGIGRMGYWLHSHHVGLKPNMVILGKALTSGHENLGLTVIDERITRSIQTQWLALGNTRSTNTMGAVAACATIQFMRDNDTISYIRNTIIPHLSEIESILKNNGFRTSLQGTMLQADFENFENFETQLNKIGLYHNWDRFWHLSFYNLTNSDMTTLKEKIKKVLQNEMD